MAEESFEVDINLEGNQLKKARIENLTSDPNTVEIGRIYFNTVSKKFFGSDGIKYFNVSEGYTHTQIVAASIWTVNHNLGYKPPAVYVTDSGGENWSGKITHVDNNTLTIDFDNASFAGVAIVN